MKLVFLRPPGAGKGTMGHRLAEHLGIPHISTGDIFRYNIKNQTELGKKVKMILDSGELVPDELTIDLVRDRLSQDDTSEGFILDGFPRTTNQADALAAINSVDKVINFVLSDEETVKRLSGRRIHLASGRVYHVLFDPPRVADKDDETGEELIQRKDDEEDSIRNRLTVYYRETQPLIEYYRSRGFLTDLDALPPQDDVFAALCGILRV